MIVLHGYGADALAEARYLDLVRSSDSDGFLLALPNGSFNANMHRFWNATDACCDFFHSNVDDVLYLTDVIANVAEHYNVDSKRVYIAGHSNGGFMAHRMACEHPELIAAIVSLAGAQFADPRRCAAASPVSVLEMHGDSDSVVSLAGGQLRPWMGNYPSAYQSVATWAAINVCADPLAFLEWRHLILGPIPPPETLRLAYGGCPKQGAVELWIMEGGPHIPKFLPGTFAAAMWEFFVAHPKQ